MANIKRPPPKKYVDYVIEDNGDVTLEAHGFEGGECRQATKDFEEALGIVTGREVKHERVEVKNKLKVGK